MVPKFLNKKEKIHKNIIDSCYNEVSVKSIIAFVLAQKRQERGVIMDKGKILVVDDESRMRKLVRDFLVKQNFEVLEAGDGEEALDIFYKTKDISLLMGGLQRDS